MIERSQRKGIPDLWLWGLLAILCLGAFWPMFRNGFVWDDQFFIVQNPALRGLWPATRFFQSQGSPAEGTIYPLTGQRPVMAFSLALDFALWKLNPFGFHLTNFLLHLLCVFGVVALIRGLSRSREAGFLAGTLFALHPGHAEGVITFLGRSDLLASLFVLLGLFEYQRHCNASGWRRALWFVGTLMSFLIACFSKETGLVLLGFLVVYEVWVVGFGKSPIPNLKSKILCLLPFLLIALAYWFYRGKVLGGQGAGSEWWGGSPGKNFLMVFEVYARYLRLLFFPLALSPLHSVPVPDSTWDWRVLLGAALLLASLVGTAWALWKRPRVGFLASWFLLGLVPVANLIPIPGVMILAERWLYLPSVGICALGGWGAWALLRRARSWTRPAWAGLMAVVLLLFGLRTFQWNAPWRNEESLARAMVALAPYNALGYYNLGNAFWHDGKYAEAEEAYREALSLKPGYPEAHFNLGKALRDQGRLDEAEEEYRLSIKLKPGFPEAHNNLGNALAGQGRYQEAEAEYREAIRLNPDFAEAHYNLGDALWNREEDGEAEKEYREAIRLKPDYAEAHNNLGVLFWNQARNGEAERELREAVRLEPGYPAALENLAEFLDKQGKRSEARLFWERALPSERRTVWVMKITERLKEKD
jgi:tetratricopeptide (TPR) repeat protein